MSKNENEYVLHFDPFNDITRQSGFTIAPALSEAHLAHLKADERTERLIPFIKNARPFCTEFVVKSAFFRDLGAHPTCETIEAIAKSAGSRIGEVLESNNLDVKKHGFEEPLTLGLSA